MRGVSPPTAIQTRLALDMPTSLQNFITATAVMAVLLVVVCCRSASAQQPRESQARSYPLRYVPAEKVAEQLQTVFASLRGEGKVAVDPRTGNLIVQGGEQAHDLALQLSQRADRPDNAGQQVARGPVFGVQPQQHIAFTIWSP